MRAAPLPSLTATWSPDAPKARTFRSRCPAREFDLNKSGKSPFGAGLDFDPAAKDFFQPAKGLFPREKGLSLFLKVFWSEFRGFSRTSCLPGQFKAFQLGLARLFCG
jgi:hypothetical protein